MSKRSTNRWWNHAKATPLTKEHIKIGMKELRKLCTDAERLSRPLDYIIINKSTK